MALRLLLAVVGITLVSSASPAALADTTVHDTKTQERYPVLSNGTKANLEFKGAIILKDNTVTVMGDIVDKSTGTQSVTPVNLTLADNLNKMNVGNVQFQGTVAVNDTIVSANGTLIERGEKGVVETMPISLSFDIKELEKEIAKK